MKEFYKSSEGGGFTPNLYLVGCRRCRCGWGWRTTVGTTLLFFFLYLRSHALLLYSFLFYRDRSWVRFSVVVDQSRFMLSSFLALFFV
jgi:hypothetical protein